MTKINTTSFPKFGNLTNGSGLSSTFDGNTQTAGWFGASGGYAGVRFAGTPKRIDRVQLLPPDNGFDASGATSTITLTLMAKQGAAPANANDGQVIGTTTFTDVNAQVWRTIECTDKVTQWDNVWVRLGTGVWSIVSELDFYEAAAPAAPTAPTPSQAIVTTYQKACNIAFPLPQGVVAVPHFTFDIATDSAGLALVDYMVNGTHVGNLFSPQYLGAIGIGAAFVYKFATDYADLENAPWQRPDNSRANGENIDERNPAHYGNVGLPTSIPIIPGFYRFSLEMTGHTDGDSRDGLAQILVEQGKGLNGFRVTVIKGGAFYDMSA